MPAYLVHGFRWPREGFSGIRVHAIVHNLEDCSVEYIQNENSRDDLLGSFRELYTDIMKDLETPGRSLEFIEQYDPEDIESAVAVSQPFAYVADKVIELAGQSIAQQQLSMGNFKPTNPLLSVDIEEIIADGPGLTTKGLEALAGLRDKIATGEKIGWWVVYNGDPERAYDSEYDQDGYEEEEEEEEATTPTAESTASATNSSPRTGNVLSSKEVGPPVPPKPLRQTVATKALPTRSGPDKAEVPGAPEVPKPEVVKPEAVLPNPKEEKIPEPSKLKETAKSSGFRKKFFGRKI